MTLQIKKGGVYAAPVAVSVKKNGVYTAVVGVFAKVGGEYQSVMGGSLFSAQSIIMEGDNYALKTSGLAGVADAKVGALSLFLTPSEDDAVDHVVVRLAGSRSSVTIDTQKRLKVTLSNGVSSFTFRTANPITPSNGVEAHYAIAFNTNAAAGLKTGIILKNGVSDVEVLSDTAAEFAPILSALDVSIGATNTGSLPGAFTLRELLWWPGAFIDWSTPATLAKVYSAGQPVNPGNSGELVTGTPPAVYLSLRGNDAAASFLVNRGTGGNFSQSAGTPTIRADEPFIPYGDSLVFGTDSSVYPNKTWVFLNSRGLNTPRRRFNYGVGGEGISAIAARFIAAIPGHAVKFPKAIYSLEGGYNSLGQSTAFILGYVQQMYDALIAAQPSAKFIYIGVPNGNSANEGIGTARYTAMLAANSGISAIVGANHFLDIRQWLIDNGLAAAGLSATADDLADIALGLVPRSLRSTDLSVHWNDYGQIAVDAAVRAKLQALGYD